ncbi:uncharacterized protein LOC129588138 isoform X2 [Paramacrobiotus metropolitanus]|nr:uncharacterized protein LOC129588138 isoform X2 [Paramacrobiotus metropolitanus]
MGLTEERQFESSPFHVQHCTIFTGKTKTLGDFFSKSGSLSDLKSQSFWMKIYFPSTQEDDEALESGFYFFAVDLSNGNSWYQHEPSLSAVTESVEEYNPGLEMEEDLLIRHLSDAVSGKSSARWRFMLDGHNKSRSSSQQPTKANIGFRMLLGGSIAFDFDFKCTSANSLANSAGVQLHFAHVVQPLIMMAAYSVDASKDLVEILHNKDKEIEDYKFQGAKPSRGTITSVPFDLTQFELARISSTKMDSFADCATDAGVVKLYETLVSARLKNPRGNSAATEDTKRKKSESPGKTKLPSPKSSPKKLPAPVKNSTEEIAVEVEEGIKPIPAPRRASSRTSAAAQTPAETSKPPSESTKKPPAKKKRGFM